MVRCWAAYPNTGRALVTHAEAAIYSKPRSMAIDGNDADHNGSWAMVTPRAFGQLLSATGFAAGILRRSDWHFNRLQFAYNSNEKVLYSALRLAVKVALPTEAGGQIVIDSLR